MIRLSDLVTEAAREMGNRVSPGHTAPHANLIKLDSNENPFGPSPRALQAMQLALNSSHLYPDDHCAELREKLSAIHGMQFEQILVTPGSTGMLSLLCQTFLSPGRNAVTSERSFIVYGMLVRAAGARLIEAPMRGDEFDLEAILAAINPHTRLVLLANPNNPTGTMIDASALDEFLARVPDHVIVVLDEAYCEFAQPFATMRKKRYPQSLDYIRPDAKVVVLRTFSKVHGLAGLRIGYGFGPGELLGYCVRMADTYSVSSAAQSAALAALDDQIHAERTVSNNTEQAKVLVAGLAELGLRPVPTFANFVYCDVGEDAAGLAARLQAEGICIRPLAAWGAPSSIRMSIGTSDQNHQFLKALHKIM